MRPAKRILELAMLGAALASAAHAQFTKPTAEELSMTAQPEVPGAAAVYLFREEDTEDKYHTWSKYVRLKVLTEKGKEYGNVQLEQVQAEHDRGYKVGEIEARTIHADGTVIPFTGTVTETLVQAGHGTKLTSKVFALPDVQVGSIIEYRYKLQYYDQIVFAPSWLIQSELFTRKAHYLWRPTTEPLVTTDERGGKFISSVAWTPLLPKNAVFKHDTVAGTGFDTGQVVMELKVDNVPPVAEEENMPPLKSRSYRLLFYYTPYLTSEQFWLQEGKQWSRARNDFIGPGPVVKAAVDQLVSASDTDDQKLRKIYAAVMQLTNTSYTRRLTGAERKDQQIKTADDIWNVKAGEADDLAKLFVGMARAAGLKAYLMDTANRSVGFFLPNYLTMEQLQDDIAIVQVGGKDLYFDPGQRYMPYGHLAWQHAGSAGVRQTDTGTKLSDTPMESYKDAKTQRVANVEVDQNGQASGTVKMTWIGPQALELRQVSLRGDNLSLQRELAARVEGLLPKGMTASISAIENLDEYEQPFVVRYDVKGRMGSATGKRLLIQGDVFEGQSRPQFAAEKRETQISFHYPFQVQDAVRIGYPAGWKVESVPPNQAVAFRKFATYTLSAEPGQGSLTVRRDFTLGTTTYEPAEYPELRDFYRKFQTNDQEPIVLATTTSKAGN